MSGKSSLAVLLLLSVTLAWGVIRFGATVQEDWNYCLLGIGACAVLLSLLKWKSPHAPALDRWMRWSILLFLGYIVFQLLPLPVGLLRLLSPQKAHLLDSLGQAGTVERFAPLSVAPPLTFAYLLRTAAYSTVFLVVREITWANRKRLWLVAAPLMLLGVFEAAYGLISHSPLVGGAARGTYVNRNHFAGLLEMVLPFLVMFALVLGQRVRRSREWPVSMVISVYGTFAFSVLLLVAILYSLSRMGLMAALASLCFMAYFAVRKRLALKWKIASLALVGIAVPIALILLAPPRMLDRFEGVAENGDTAAELRMSAWVDTLHLVNDYPLFGCGLGGYASTFLKYQTVSPGWSFPHAHNDYLQWVAETGIAGVIFPAVFIAVLLPKIVRATSRRLEAKIRYLALACLGSLTAIAIHSLTDFNTHIPSNALVIAWVAAIAVALGDRAGVHRTNSRPSEAEEHTPARQVGQPQSLPAG